MAACKAGVRMFAADLVSIGAGRPEQGGSVGGWEVDGELESSGLSFRSSFSS